MIYFIIMGQPPLSELPPLYAAQAAALVHKRSTLRPNIDKRLKDLVDECWQPSPSLRPTAARACEILEKVAADYPVERTEGCCSLS